MMDMYTFLDSIFRKAKESKPEKEDEVIDVAFEEITEENANES